MTSSEKHSMSETVFGLHIPQKLQKAYDLT